MMRGKETEEREGKRDGRAGGERRGKCGRGKETDEREGKGWGES